MESIIRDFLESRAASYNDRNFIATDPISIPHLFHKKEDIEIIGFLVATIAWGNRKAILRSGEKLVALLHNEPYEFVMNASKTSIQSLQFVHRTFNAEDLRFFIRALRDIYSKYGGLEAVFKKEKSASERIAYFRQVFLETRHAKRSEKHLPNPLMGSSCKRINMFLRWMVRCDKRGVDFGLWRGISPASLMIPLDIHTGRVARLLGLLDRKQNDWKAVEELTAALRTLDIADPVKYDFALFGSGVNGELDLELPR